MFTASQDVSMKPAHGDADGGGKCGGGECGSCGGESGGDGGESVVVRVVVLSV